MPHPPPAGRRVPRACAVRGARLVGCAWALAAAALLALSGALALPATAQAQETALLSNLGQSNFEGSPALAVGSFRHAQGFTTGSNASGYHLGSVELDVYTLPKTPADVTVERCGQRDQRH